MEAREREASAWVLLLTRLSALQLLACLVSRMCLKTAWLTCANITASLYWFILTYNVFSFWPMYISSRYWQGITYTTHIDFTSGGRRLTNTKLCLWDRRSWPVFCELLVLDPYSPFIELKPNLWFDYFTVTWQCCMSYTYLNPFTVVLECPSPWAYLTRCHTPEGIFRIRSHNSEG